MSISKFNPRSATLLLIVVVVAALRTATNFSTEMSPFSHFNPLGALALFGGAYFTGKAKPFAFPLLALFISDVILSLTVYKQYSNGLLYSGWYWTYGAFALMALTGKLFIKKVSIQNIFWATVICVMIHWIVTDFGVWLDGTMYSKDFNGWWLCMAAAVPYELKFAAGTIIYSGVLFGTFEWLQHRYPQLRSVAPASH